MAVALQMFVVFGGWQDRALAAEDVAVRAATHGSFGRIVFDWPERVEFAAVVSGTTLEVRFSEPLSSDLEPVLVRLPSFVRSASLKENGKVVEFELTGSFGVRSFYNRRSVVLDLLVEGLADGTPKASAPAKVNVRTGVHAEYSRVVFDWTEYVGYRAEKTGPGTITIEFDRSAEFDLSALVDARVPRIRSARVSFSEEKTLVRIEVAEATGLRHMRVGTKVVIDVKDLDVKDAPERTISARPPSESVEAVQPAPVRRGLPPQPGESEQPKRPTVAVERTKIDGEQVGAPVFLAAETTSEEAPRAAEKEAGTESAPKSPAGFGARDAVSARAQREEAERRADAQAFAPQGFSAGNFLVFPSLGVAERYDDNIFATSGGEIDDFITVLSPALRMESDFSNHELNLRASGEIGRYADSSGEDFDDLTLGMDGRLEVRRSTSLLGALSLQRLHESRTSPDDAAGVNPTEFELVSSRVTFSQQLNRLSLELGGGVNQFDYDDGRTPIGVINHDDRDRTESRASLRLAYVVTPDLDAQIQGTLTDFDYDAAVDDAGLNRDSEDSDFLAGAVFNVTGVTTVDFLVGYFTRAFDDVVFKDIDGTRFRAGLNWDPSALTSLRATLERSVEETTIAGASDVLRVAANLDLSHEFRRNLRLTVGAEQLVDEFEGSTREDRTVSLRAGIRYLINPTFVLDFNLGRVDRDSDLATADFLSNTATLRLVVRR